MTLDRELLRILACPKCRGDLRLAPDPAEDAEAQGLFCAACAVVYPIEDGIPVLLVEEAVPAAQWAGKLRSG